jgi:hypothetical protein
VAPRDQTTPISTVTPRDDTAPATTPGTATDDVAIDDVAIGDPRTDDRDTACAFADETTFVTGPSTVGVGTEACGTLTSTFADAPLLGGDYQRAYPLPNGDVLWLFQDVFVSTTDGPRLVHNAGVLQRDDGTELLITETSGWPSSYLFADRTIRYRHWYWPLDGEIGVDGALHVFMAEMVEHGSAYLTFVEPVATWTVTIDVEDLHIVDRGPAPDASAALYGWSVVSAGEHTYLYAHCYRQFGWDELWFAPGVFAHDLDCTADVTLARLPRGMFDAEPEYWDGDGWTDDPALADPVIPTEGRAINPTQVELLDGVFVAVTKVGDWWGNEIVLDAAPAPEGPWTTYGTVAVSVPCDDCDTYFASIVPFGADEDTFVVALSCNVWEGVDLEHYRPLFLAVPRPD